MDVDEQSEVAQAQNVEAMPTFKFFRDGQKGEEDVVGADFKDLEAKVRKLAGKWAIRLLCTPDQYPQPQHVRTPVCSLAHISKRSIFHLNIQYSIHIYFPGFPFTRSLWAAAFPSQPVYCA